MGKDYFCDMCRKPVPLDTALQDIMIGGDKIGELCLTCSSQLRTVLGKQIAEAQAQMSTAQKTAAVEPQAPVASATEAPLPSPNAQQ